MPRVGAPGQANWVPPPQVTCRRWQPRLPKPSAARVSGEARHGSAPDESPREHLPRAEGPPPALSVRPLRRQGWGGEPKSLSLSHSQVSRLTRAILGRAWKPGLVGARQGPQEPSLWGGAWLGGSRGRWVPPTSADYACSLPRPRCPEGSCRSEASAWLWGSPPR